MKNILIYSNMYPSSQKSYAGIFVKNQFEHLNSKDQKNKYSILALERTFTGKIGSIKKYLSFYKKSFLFSLRFKPDIIHLHYFYPLLPIVCVLKKVNKAKIIITVHGSDLYEKMNNRYIKFFYSKLLRYCDYIICVGEKLKDDFEKNLRVPVNEVLSAGVDTNVFHPLTIKKEFDFIFVGSLINRKGFDIILKLINRTAERYTWCIVGSGKYENEVQVLAKEYVDRVFYFKSVNQNDLNRLYNKSRWFLFPSRNEPFGLVASESIFAHTPIICSLNGGLKEQVINNINGFAIIDVDNLNTVEQMLDDALNLSETAYSKLVSNCIYSNTRFSLEYVCNRLINIYENI